MAQPGASGGLQDIERAAHRGTRLRRSSLTRERGPGNRQHNTVHKNSIKTHRSNRKPEPPCATNRLDIKLRPEPLERRNLLLLPCVCCNLRGVNTLGRTRRAAALRPSNSIGVAMPAYVVVQHVITDPVKFEEYRSKLACR